MQEQEVASLRAKLAAISKSTAHSAAADALKLAEQVQCLPIKLAPYLIMCSFHEVRSVIVRCCNDCR